MRSLRERAEAAGAQALMRLPGWAQQALAGGPVVVDGQTLAPEVQLLLQARQWLRMPGLSDEPPPEARVRLRRDCLTFSGDPVPVATVRDLTLELAPPAAPRLRARHYAPPHAGAGRPLIVFIHGGGFVVGGLDSHEAVCRLLCVETRAHVLAVEYRLAPEHQFPQPVDDVLAAFAWARANAAALGADPARVGVAGDSAGGNLAAVVAQQTARAGAPPAQQLLLYPVVDRADRMPSRDLFAEGFLLTQRDIDWYDHCSLGGLDVDRTDPRISPIYAPDVSNLPPTVIVTAAFDPLRDEGEAYAARLRAAGVPTELQRAEGLIHGFANLAGISPRSRAALVAAARAVGAQLDAVSPRAAAVAGAGS